MRVALLAPLISVIREPQIGGVATLICDLAAALTRAGVELDLFAASGSAVDGVSVVDTGVVAADLAETLFRPLASPAPAALAAERLALARGAYRQAFGLIASGGYDVVHNHAFDAPAIDEALALAGPVVHTLHLPPDPGVAAALAEAAGARRAPVVAAVSTSQRRAWEAAGTRIDVLVAAGVPVARIPWSAGPGGPVLFAGRLSPEKGVLEAIEIARGAGRELLIAGGPYDPAYADQVREVAGTSGDVRLLGALPRMDLWDVMAAAGALVFPIGWEEPFGLVTAEAQAAGCPVIGYARGALPDVVLDGVTGALIAPGDVGGATAALAALERYDRTACRRHAEQHLDVTPMVAAHLALYERLAGA